MVVAVPVNRWVMVSVIDAQVGATAMTRPIASKKHAPLKSNTDVRDKDVCFIKPYMNVRLKGPSDTPFS
ncbi:hypothetical protein SAMN05421874_11114 [Nonomuraea maritima]|uniref:Uncharacterized protein n=1 Tax=Nonomuraea maritima TaxID=683260 RepID=A0A1G9EJV7_9ACTN|nr:hypothetical protein SAMN05421874_11114 [Nonomuraea maritima]